MVESRYLFAGVVLGLLACAAAAVLLPPPGRAVFAFVGLALAALLLWAATAAAQSRVVAPVPATPPGPADPASSIDAVLEALPVGIIIIGEDLRIRVFNQTAAGIFNVSSQPAAGRALIEIVRSFELDRRLAAALRDAVEESGEVAYRAAQERTLLVTTRVLSSPAGQREALAIVSDLTPMRELESLRREFVSNVSHELRTPLTAVKLMVETLRSGVDRTASEEFLTSIAQETERMIKLVEDLLDLARLETGKLELRLGAVDLNELCQQAVDGQAQRAAAVGISLHCAVASEPLVISADRDKLYQVLVNLLDNALRHTPPHGSIAVSASRHNGDVRLVVQDTGSGIPSAALAHIFERFYVVDAARAKTQSGTGLGLAIVKHIIEVHGGSISVESALGVGTTFSCLLHV
ncbi:MAG: ATP-binding protein [Candidatus Eremiobacteraeota bacterium]|nr:ATP-binding protein [Candidatus Eremiobacteraeota bacterium]